MDAKKAMREVKWDVPIWTCEHVQVVSILSYLQPTIPPPKKKKKTLYISHIYSRSSSHLPYCNGWSVMCTTWHNASGATRASCASNAIRAARSSSSRKRRRCAELTNRTGIFLSTKEGGIDEIRWKIR
ncbi:hypothetical protein BC936DRAFT_148861 [Jimgerdemannia flammicorona]|uniref:Uncharacterized protein n=1 Tax=Jimgerdemannia flammicorona TaxID=994334 RepID=A0A433D245_9FUNG|nr:hypothetical protein BC936DRAFT_148861 [Jimgerdemannia flammicorona]